MLDDLFKRKIQELHFNLKRFVSKAFYILTSETEAIQYSLINKYAVRIYFR